MDPVGKVLEGTIAGVLGDQGDEARALRDLDVVNRQAGDCTRMTGLTAASLPSMKTLKITLGYRARFEPLLMLSRFSSAPTRATNRS